MTPYVPAGHSYWRPLAQWYLQPHSWPAGVATLEWLLQAKPAAHSEQNCAPPLEKLPSGQGCGSIHGSGHMKPAGQSAQDEAPPASAYSPTPQRTGSDAGSSQVWPAGHAWHTDWPPSE